MPIKVIRVDIFISSPGDLIEERKIIRRVIEKINRSSLRNSYFLVPLLYEDEVPPEIGKEAQLIIDRYMQVKNSYILVSLFWTRMGTPFTIIETKERYESGTQYEILKGYENFQEKGLPHILLYKKEKENPAADPIQKEKVENFFNGFFEDPPKIKGLFSKYTDPSEFEVTVEEHLLKLIHTYPPSATKDSLTEAPEFKEEARRIDAAIPRQTAIGESIPVQVMICLPKSDGLKTFLPEVAQNNYEIEKRDVRAGGLTIAFPKDKSTGKVMKSSVIVEIEAADFRIEKNLLKVQLTAGLDSGLITFNLVPLYARKYSMVVVRVKSTSLDGGEVECGSVVLYTVIKGTKAQLVSQTLWDVVSYSLNAVSLHNAVKPSEIEGGSYKKASIVLLQHPIYSRVDATPNGPILAEIFQDDFVEIPNGNVVINGRIYAVYRLDKEIQLRLKHSSEYGWIRVYGQSMNASFPMPINEGDYVLFIKDQQLNHGEIVIASIPDETGAGYRVVVKRCVIDTHYSFNAILKSESTDEQFEPLPIKDATIIGKVIAVAKLDLERVLGDEL